ncbi:MAG: hypothetical protein AAF598_02525 [Bacteroidota bacterium]
MHTKWILCLALATALLIAACQPDELPEPELPIEEPPTLPTGTSFIAPSDQRSGDASAGQEYLIYGNYVSSGIPYNIYKLVFGDDTENALNRTGDNATIGPGFTAVDYENGTRVVVGNCLTCHGQHLNGNYYVGLGNTLQDFTADQSSLIPLVDQAIIITYGANSPEWEAYLPFRQAIVAVGPHLVTDVVGINAADMLTAVLVAHRDKDDLTWSDTPLVPIPAPGELVPTDVPPWWHLKKKNAMFYSGIGRGDFAKFLMSSSLLTMKDSAEARIIDDQFANVLEFIKTIEPPAFVGPIDEVAANRGAAIFESNCQQCHGSYGSEESYPNLLVNLDRIGTDSLLATVNYSSNQFVDWYNASWFANSDDSPGELVVTGAYVAPPLDGIWASAPYLHNGSVPTLQDLLKSAERPTFWERSFDTNDYDFDKIGWNYETRTSKLNAQTYDTTKPGYGNQGHTFGDNLSDTNRADLIEYLKTL